MRCRACPRMPQANREAFISAHYSPFPSTLFAMWLVNIFRERAIDFVSKRFAECE
jgi:hypothetical protein